MDVLTITAQGWNNLVFGDPVIMALFVLLTFMIFGIFQGWSVEIHLVVLVPLIATLSFFILPIWIFALVLVGMGIIVFLAVKKLLNP